MHSNSSPPPSRLPTLPLSSLSHPLCLISQHSLKRRWGGEWEGEEKRARKGGGEEAVLSLEQDGGSSDDVRGNNENHGDENMRGREREGEGEGESKRDEEVYLRTPVAAQSPLCTPTRTPNMATPPRTAEEISRSLSSKKKKAVIDKHLKELVCGLPEERKETFFVLFPFLRLVSQHSEKNKMTVNNIARMFAPAVIRQQDRTHDLSTHSHSLISLPF